jgi:hypothetical protein
MPGRFELPGIVIATLRAFAIVQPQGLPLPVEGILDAGEISGNAD